jgi:aryl-phospho-beta-D-glucosidase BglC (GH1 family)
MIAMLIRFAIINILLSIYTITSFCVSQKATIKFKNKFGHVKRTYNIPTMIMEKGSWFVNLV